MQSFAIERFATVVRHLDPGVDTLIVGETEAVCYQQRNDRCTPLAPFPFRTESFWFHKGIEDAHIGGTLAWIVL